MKQVPAIKRLLKRYDLPGDATEEQILEAVVKKGEKGLSREAGKLLRSLKAGNKRIE